MDTNYPSTKDCGPHTAAPSQRRKIFTDAEFEQRKRELWSSLSKKTSEISTAREKLFENTEDILRYGSLNAILDERSKSQVQSARRVYQAIGGAQRQTGCNEYGPKRRTHDVPDAVQETPVHAPLTNRPAAVSTTSTYPTTLPPAMRTLRQRFGLDKFCSRMGVSE